MHVNVKLGPFCTSVWAVLNVTWAVLVLSRGPFSTFLLAVLVLGRFGQCPTGLCC